MKIEALNKEKILSDMGYEVRTTFYEDFSIADNFGLFAIKDTYKRAFKEWKNNVEYITELNMVLNWKGFRWYDVNEKYSELYFSLFTELREWCFENLKGEDLEYYIKTTD